MRISTYMHGVMDYVIGVVLLVAPNVFSFNGTPGMVARVIGCIILAQAIMTNFEAGLIRVLPMRLHLMMDYLIGAVLAASPWIWGFHAAKTSTWMPHLIVGLLIIAQATMTTAPRRAISVNDVTEDRDHDINTRRAA